MRTRALLLSVLASLLALVGPPSALAQDATSAASPAANGATIEELYAFTLPDGAVPDAVGGAVFLRFTVAPGTSFDFSVSCWVSPAVDAWYVETGRFAIQPAAPATLVRAASGSGERRETVAAGKEVLLGPGDLIVYVGLPPVPGSFRNPGPEPVSGLVFGVWGTEVAGCPPSGMIEPWIEYQDGSAWTLPPGPLAVALRRVMLPPGAAAPLPEMAPGGALEFLHAEAGSPTEEGVGPTRRLTNAGDEPLVVLILTIDPAGAEGGTPAAGMPRPERAEVGQETRIDD